MAFGSVLGQKPPELDNSKIKIDANQIVSGVLPLIRGGTGQTTIQGLKNALGIPSSMGMTKIFNKNYSGYNPISDTIPNVNNYKILIGITDNVSVQSSNNMNCSYWRYDFTTNKAERYTSDRVNFYPLNSNYVNQAGFFFVIKDTTNPIAFALNIGGGGSMSLIHKFSFPSVLYTNYSGSHSNNYLRLYGIN